jgi:hypothetical protein
MRQYHRTVMKNALFSGFLCVIACAGVTASAAENENLNFELSLDWKMENQAERLGYVIKEYVRSGATSITGESYLLTITSAWDINVPPL